MFKEEKRQAVHILLLVFAFSLKYLNRTTAALLLFGFLLVVLFIVPRLRGRHHFYRREDKKYSQGAVNYFLVLLVLVLVFPFEVVAASWGILALGDGMATLVGKNFKTQELAWNRNKSYIGSVAFILFGTVGAYVLLRWMSPDLTTLFVLGVSFKAATVSAIVESLPWKIDDNISVPLVSAVVVSWLI
ncbi:MAG: hypothetical protein HUU49_03700 [Candidatus Buchananbacteria bacterium]|nr:hypothetical protein [Candidatus Buchananbacteria bacterium]